MMLKEHPLGGGKVRLALSSVECLGGVSGSVVLWALILRACRVCGFVGGLAVLFGFLAHLEPLVHTACILRSTLRFLII
jgi:hypothetical protein